jgi:hypothetical protein
MIDSATGDISIRNADVVIGSSLTRTTFLSSSIGKCAEVSVENGPYCSYNAKIAAHDLMELTAILTLYFHDEQLDSVSITASDVYGGEKVWRVAGESCSALVRRNPRWSVVGGSRRGI